jgi:mRNA-degrading endonuclease toxin of MazEF toxin-antitoxin module
MRRGQICFVNFDGKGTEIQGPHPAIVIHILPRVNLAIVIPLTTNLEVLEKYPLTHLIRATGQSGLNHDSVAEVFHIRSCHLSRFSRNNSGDVVTLGEISTVEKRIINDLIKSEIQFS